MITIITTILLCISLTLGTVSNSFAVNIATMGLDPSLIATYLAEDESKNTEIINVVNYFINDHIRPDMTDFEKEIQIIKYLVANVTYDVEELSNDSPVINDSYKAYGALVNHKAVCSGYAKAFDLLAKKCGLSTIVVTGEAINSSSQNGAHAWNQIYLDGEWYNVDVTFEDPITDVILPYGQLFNNYINRTDAEFSSNHIRANGHSCTATKYGKNLVAYYLNTGIVDFNANVDAIRKMYEQQIGIYSVNGNEAELKSTIDKLLLIGAKYDNNANFIASGNDAEITTYILTHLAMGENVVTVVTGPGTQNRFSIDSGNWLKDYVSIPGRVSMQRIFSSDGEFDTRILIFKIG
jgi:phosphotransferase system HPr-like phosphotransfer protein